MGARWYRKKPVRVEAMLFNIDNGNLVAGWCGGRVAEVIDHTESSGHRVVLQIPTLEGTMEALIGDYVIRGTRGEFYPCKPGPFEDTFEAAPSPITLPHSSTPGARSVK